MLLGLSKEVHTVSCREYLIWFPGQVDLKEVVYVRALAGNKEHGVGLKAFRR